MQPDPSNMSIMNQYKTTFTPFGIKNWAVLGNAKERRLAGRLTLGETFQYYNRKNI